MASQMNIPFCDNPDCRFHNFEHLHGGRYPVAIGGGKVRDIGNYYWAHPTKPAIRLCDLCSCSPMAEKIYNEDANTRRQDTDPNIG